MSLQQQAPAPADALPESPNREDAIATTEELAALQVRLQEGEADIAAGRTKTHEDVMNKYLGYLTGERR